ncbi:MAG: PilZ domain-containing protein [Planctomycetota bacterium]|nr:PilZ domain-containing protein [Planctomycetota bacterium]
MQSVAERDFQITQCVTCDQPLPTLVVGGSGPTREWECRNCGATYLASLAPSAPDHLRAAVKLSHYFLEYRAVESTLCAKDLERELRRHPRRPVMMCVPAVELDDELFPAGEDFTVISRNLSSSGIAIVHTHPLEGKLAVLIELPEIGHVQLLVNIVRCKKVGQLYEMGGAFFDRR